MTSNKFLCIMCVLQFNSLFLALIILLVFLVLAIVMKKVVRRLTVRLKLTSNLQILFSNSIFYCLIIIGIISALGTLGVNISVLVAGLGITGFALGFACKDIISNFLAGIFILLYHPFTIGDYVKIASSEGTVIEINLRYTIMEGKNGERILIPNSITFTKEIVVKKKS